MTPPTEYWNDLTPDEQAKISDAYENACAQTAGWHHPDTAVHEAVRDTLTARLVQSEQPVAAEALARPWTDAIQVRFELESMGRHVEGRAIRLAPTWHLPIHDLIQVASDLGSQSPDAGSRPSKL